MGFLTTVLTALRFRAGSGPVVAVFRPVYRIRADAQTTHRARADVVTTHRGRADAQTTWRGQADAS